MGMGKEISWSKEILNLCKFFDKALCYTNYNRMKIRKTLRILHRDLGYFIVGMTIVYSLSGILLNHRHDFNPDYRIIVEDFDFEPAPISSFSEERIKSMLADQEYELEYKKHYFSKEGIVKVFIENGEVAMDPVQGNGRYQFLERRPILFEMNRLHRATLGTVWKWASDLMAFILLFVAVSGLLILKGKRSLSRWGWWWTLAGFIVPLAFALLLI